METYIPISFLNDFIFCPRSIYFHQLYGRMNERAYQSTDQTNGKAAHAAVDTQKYSTSKHVLQGIEVYSTRYGLGGKIDSFDSQKGVLTERKKKIKVIYDGYIFQLYAQYFCLTDMHYKVSAMRLYSMDDNKVYAVELPHLNPTMFAAFEQLIETMKNFDLDEPFRANASKCARCIYSPVCDIGAEEDVC